MCSKIPISIKGHLEDRCMKGCSAVEIAAQVDIAKESTRVWTATQRVWEYNTLVKLLPDHVSRMAMVKYLIQNGYLILNKPCDEDMDCAREAPGTSNSVTAATSAVATSAVACPASSRKHAGNACSTRCDGIVDGMPTVHDCNLVLRSGKKRFLDIYNRMAISKIVVSPTEKTWYRYYCEAVMMLRHFQRPGAVEGMTVREWVNRKLTDGRYLIGIKNHKTGATHVATIALTLEEEAWYQGYYECIRPEVSLSCLAIKSFDGQKGEGVVATTHFTEGDIVCDYHGKVITKAEGEMMMKDQGDQAGYLFFFNAGGEALCIDAQTWPCPCHDGVETFGRKINHSSKHPNIKPLCVVLRLGDEDVHTILFKATRDIKVDTELKFNYGVNRTSFRGEALHLDWLDE
ncbi:hypothetical protein KUCAC02_013379 [Chaenocephalus aceratus]|nr:hypothetical protein KUCAC02_013379 [Chaenocephalus aceratus]